MKTISKIFVTVCVMLFTISKINAQVSVGVSVGIAPPELPVYVQPECPVDGYLWQPGYWAYDDVDGYYWVPGVWVAPPEPDYLWTPAYWGYEGGRYGFHQGYWGSHVGFYGGINYGYGYGGVGFYGGMWSGGHFRYNTAVVNVNRTVIHNTYINRTVINNRVVNNHVAFNGPGGVNARPRPQDLAVMHEHHIQPTAQQMAHQHQASQTRSQFASANHGHPAAAAMNKVGGRPFTAQGHEAKNVAFGHSGPPAKAAEMHQAAANRAKPAVAEQNNTARPQQARVQQHTVQQQHAQQERAPQMHTARATQQPRVEPRPVAPRVEQQHAQAPRSQPEQHFGQPRPQAARVEPQHVQAPRPQPQQHVAAPQPHGNPGGGGHEKRH